MCPGKGSCAYSDVQIETRLFQCVRERRERSEEVEMSEKKKSVDSPGKTIAKHRGGKSTCSSP